MRKKFFSAFLLGLLTLGTASTVTSCKDYDDDIASLKQDITNNATSLQGLVDQKVNNINTEIAALKAEHASLQSQIDDAKNKTNEQITALKSADAELVLAILGLQDAVDAVKAQHATDIATLMVQDAELTAAIEVANAKIAEVISRVEKAEGDITNLKTIAETLQTQVAALRDDVDALKALVNAAATQASVEAQLNDLKAALTGEGDAKTLAELTAQVAALNAYASGELEVAVNNLKADYLATAAVVAQNAEDIAAIKEELAEIAAQTAYLLEYVGGIDLSVYMIQEDLMNMQQDIEAVAEALELKVAGINAAIEDLQDLYDAQFDSIDIELDTLNGTIWRMQEQINTLINDKADAEAVAELAELVEGLDIEIDTVRGTVGKMQDDLNTVISDLNTYMEENDLALDTMRGTIEKLRGDLNTLIGENAASFDELREYIDQIGISLNWTIEELLTKIDILNNEMYDAINDSFDAVMLAVYNESHALKALVFNPDTYYHGIEAIAINTFEYKKETKNLMVANAAEDQIEDHPVWATAYSYTTPVVKSSYYLNPSNAHINMDKAAYSYLVNNATYSRAKDGLDQSEIKVDSVVADKKVKGKVNVYSSIKNAEQINQLSWAASNDKIDVVALRYKDVANDTTITSDFAALKRYHISDMQIALKKDANTDLRGNMCSIWKNGLLVETNQAEVAKTAKEAAKNAKASVVDGDLVDNYNNYYNYPILKVVYDTKNGIDLNKVFTVHYNYEDPNGYNHVIWGDQAKINESGFELQYELIGWKSGNNNTMESVHAKFTDAGNGQHILMPCGYQNETGRQIIDRLPLVRTKLVDHNNDDNVVAVGYTLLWIYDKETAVIDQNIDIDPYTEGFTLKCNDDKAFRRMMTWDEFENQILANNELGEEGASKSDFQKNYTPVKYGWDSSEPGLNYPHKMKVYTKNAEGKFVETTDLGIIDFTDYDDWGSNKTNVFIWKITTAQAFNYFFKSDGSLKNPENPKMEAYVRFTINGTNKHLNIKMTWTLDKDKIKVTPAATLKDDNKLANAWYLAGTTAKGTDEVHFTVTNGTDESKAYTFNEFYCEKLFKNSPLESIKAGLADYTELYNAIVTNGGIKYTFKKNQPIKEFVGVSGTKYNISVSSDGTQILANGTAVLATIANTSTGKINLNQWDPVFQDILNAAKSIPSTEIANAFYFTISMGVKTCDPAESNGLLKLNNFEFDVRLITPLNITDAKCTGMEWNNAASQKQPLKITFADFNNYSPAKFTTNSNWSVKTNNAPFFTYYGITGFVQEGKITTDYSGSWGNIDANGVGGQLTMEYLNDYEVDANGYVKENKYGNLKMGQENADGSHTTHVKVPMKAIYRWGKLGFTVEVTITPQSSVGSAKKN